jgi:F0F1-type ATP synthase membrane subunit b/b'
LIPDLSVAWVIALVLTLSILLDRLLLRPLTRVMREREGAIRSARDLAEASRTKAQVPRMNSTRAREPREPRSTSQMDDKRRAALERRAELVAATRREIEQTVHEASDRLRAQTAAARQQIGRDADALAAPIVERVLGRKAS